MRIDIITIFPEMFAGPLDASILKRAQEAGVVDFRVHDLRHWGVGKHRVTDDEPFGGGPGMVMKPEPFFDAVTALRCADDAGCKEQVILLDPAGQVFNHAAAQRLAAHDHLILLCGRYEGVDERVRTLADLELSIGDFVLTGGELAALVVADAVARLRPGALGDPESARQESFAENGLLDYPHYTRPAEFRGMSVPEVLRSGNHEEIARWRRDQAEARTRERRPDIWARRGTEESR